MGRKIKPEIGKRYIRRDGVVTSVLVENVLSQQMEFYPLYDQENKCSYTKDGRYLYNASHSFDLYKDYIPIKEEIEKEIQELEQKLKTLKQQLNKG